jgi:hypothetical protein
MMWTSDIEVQLLREAFQKDKDEEPVPFFTPRADLQLVRGSSDGFPVPDSSTLEQ